MKQATITTFALLFLCASLTTKAQETSQGKKTKTEQNKMNGDMGMQQASLAYKVSYSSNFTMGKSAQVKMVLDLYQAYDANDFSKTDWFADTLLQSFRMGIWYMVVMRS
jgi:hypothetical protein